jgi:hypothetical protein
MREENNRACREYRRRRKAKEEQAEQHLLEEEARNRRLKARLRLVEARRDRAKSLVIGFLLAQGAPVSHLLLRLSCDVI